MKEYTKIKKIKGCMEVKLVQTEVRVYENGLRPEEIVKLVHAGDDLFLVCYKNFMFDLIDLDAMYDEIQEEGDFEDRVYTPLKHLKIEIDQD